jgi:Protein of unknown function (DUF2510)
MNATFAAMTTAKLGPIVGIVVISVLFGVIDILRRPNWAWRAAGESKALYLLMVLALPGVGLAIYVFGARTKVVEIAANGRAASLPFERFGDRAASTVERARAIQALAPPTMRGSFGETLRRPLRAQGTPDPVPAGVNFFDDPDVISVGSAADLFTTGGTGQVPVAIETVTVPAPESSLRIPTQTGRPYNPRQRSSLDEGPIRGPSLARVVADVAGGPRPGGIAARATGSRAVSQTAGAVATAIPPTTPAPRVGPARQAAGEARWMQDPTGRHQYRFWDGSQWTENVYDAGAESRDPVSS